MCDSNVANAAKESTQGEFSHGLLDFCTVRHRLLAFLPTSAIVRCRSVPLRTKWGPTMGRLRFGPSLKNSRVRLGLSQTELGKKLNPQVAQATVSQWEQEHSLPSNDQKAQIRQVLGEISSTSDAKSAATNETEETITSPSAIGTWLNKHRLAKHLSVPELAAQSGLSTVAIYNIESGQSQNPQQKTINKLEKALGSKLSPEAKEVAKEDSTIEGVGEWFNFDPNSEADWPTVGGIYVLYDISDRPIYVGQGQNISTRLRDHHQKFWFRQPIVQSAAFVGIANKVLREQIERVLIKFLKRNAVLNQQNVDR
jgi:transcriptional regulator with XRE-family HTH domain